MIRENDVKIPRAIPEVRTLLHVEIGFQVDKPMKKGISIIPLQCSRVKEYSCIWIQIHVPQIAEPLVQGVIGPWIH
ncbi:MAG: hypothetical protein ACPLJI_02125 [Methanothermobacter sp.]|uniref:hypothetical protein n=1 Tax=Methanothermobacter sp. TaxID=1884223 RepID=UPI003C750660